MPTSTDLYSQQEILRLIAKQLGVSPDKVHLKIEPGHRGDNARLHREPSVTAQVTVERGAPRD